MLCHPIIFEYKTFLRRTEHCVIWSWKVLKILYLRSSCQLLLLYVVCFSFTSISGLTVVSSGTTWSTTKSPKPIVTYDQILYTFQRYTWLGFLFTFIAMILVFKLIHSVYSTEALKKYNLAGKVTHELDFVILTLASITEPDPISWFPRPSAGN